MHSIGAQKAKYKKFPRYVISTQQVNISIGSGASTNTATINAIDPNFSFLIYGGGTSNGSASDGPVAVEITNSTTITATRGTTTATTTTVCCTVVYCSKEFVKSVQSITIALSTAQTSNTGVVNAVDTNNAIVINSGTFTTGSVTGATSQGALILTNGTTVTVTRGGTSSTTMTQKLAVVEFQPGIITKKQSFATTFSNASSTNTDTLSQAYDLTRSILFFQGYNSSTTAINTLYTQQLTGPTTVTYIRNATTSVSRQPVCTIVEFKPGVIKYISRGVKLLASGSATGTVVPDQLLDAQHGWVQNTGTQTGTGLGSTIRVSAAYTDPSTVTFSHTDSSGDSSTGYEIVGVN